MPVLDDGGHTRDVGGHGRYAGQGRFDQHAGHALAVRRTREEEDVVATQQRGDVVSHAQHLDACGGSERTQLGLHGTVTDHDRAQARTLPAQGGDHVDHLLGMLLGRQVTHEGDGRQRRRVLPGPGAVVLRVASVRCQHQPPGRHAQKAGAFVDDLFGDPGDEIGLPVEPAVDRADRFTVHLWGDYTNRVVDEQGVPDPSEDRVLECFAPVRDDHVRSEPTHRPPQFEDRLRVQPGTAQRFGTHPEGLVGPQPPVGSLEDRQQLMAPPWSVQGIAEGPGVDLRTAGYIGRQDVQHPQIAPLTTGAPMLWHGPEAWHSPRVRAADGARAMKGLAAAARVAVRQARGRDAPWEPGFDHSPRPCPPGLVWGPPDFVGIGAQRAGTTWWYDLICAHPGVYHHRPFHKERHFLSALGGAGTRDDRLADYAGWFPRPAGRLTGEWTPDYLFYHWVPPLLAQAAPSAKLLVLLRDPVERFRSGLAHQAANGSAHSAPGAQEAFARGLYAAQLARWESCFPSTQLLVLLYEQCRADPVTNLASTYRFLGLPDDFVPAQIDAPHPTGTTPVLRSERVALLRRLYEPDLAALAGRYPQLDLSAWPSLAQQPSTGTFS